ncbi:MAG TPA: hypothetical protein VLV50_01000 [Stellaceae bacterium]|nr:hypothetical protein [Stellaceae bacterium]
MATMVYAGAGMWRGGKRTGVFRVSAEGGQPEQLTNGLPDPCSVHTIVVNPHDPAIVYIGTHDGLYVSHDRGQHWMRPDFPDHVQIWSILVHPAAPRTILAGASPVAVYRSDDGGERWRLIAKPTIEERVQMGFPCRVMRLAIDAKRPDDVFAAIEVNGVIRSRDGGATWSDCSKGLIAFSQSDKYKSRIGSATDAEGMLDEHAVAVSQADPGAVWLANRMGLFRSADGGDTWQDVEVSRYSKLTYARDIRPAPNDPTTLYAALSVHSTGPTGSLARSRDLGKSWERIDHGVEAKGTMMYLALDARDPNQVWGVTRPGQVIGTSDGGKSWREMRLPEGCGDCYTVACG